MDTRLLAVVLAAAGACVAQEWKPLFDGEDLEGWTVDTPGVWSVHDGIIVGKSPGLKYNDFLRTKGAYSDFELKYSIRLVDGKGNSGVQFRTSAVPNSHEVSGYQSDAGEQYWGCLYDESRRNKILVQGTPEAVAAIRKDGWNDSVVTARGKSITIDVNGVRAVTYSEPDDSIARTGFIALQVHGGAPFEVQFKNIAIRELK